MERILLIDTNTTPFNEVFPVYPTGLDYLQGALRKQGLNDTHILDLTRSGGPLHSLDFQERKRRSKRLIEETLAQGHWDIVGVSLRNIDSTYPIGDGDATIHYYLPDLVDYVDCVTKSSKGHRFTVLGGTAFSMMPEVFLENQPDTCYGIQGPSESSFPDLVKRLLSGGTASRLTRSSDHKIGKLQNRELIRKYLNGPVGESTFGIRTKIGCGQSCGYCPYPLVNGPRQVLKDVDEVIEELDLIRGTYDEVKCTQPVRVMFADDIFNRPLDHAKSILKAMKDSNLPLDSWHAYLDPKGIDEEFMELIFETNGWCQPRHDRTNDDPRERSFFFPLDIESGSPKILRKLRKPYEVSDIVASVETFKRVAKKYERRSDIGSIHLGLHFLLGYPGEDEETIRETCQLIRGLKPSQIAFQVGIRIYPQTPLAKETQGSLWQKETDLVKPTFTGINQSRLLDSLRRYLNPEYERMVQKGNMILVS